MTFRASLARYLRGVLEEPSTPTTLSHPMPNPESTPTTTTPSTTTSGISEVGTLAVVLETMRTMQEQNLREIRGMVMDILQGRALTPEEYGGGAPSGATTLADAVRPAGLRQPGDRGSAGEPPSSVREENSEQDQLRQIADGARGFVRLQLDSGQGSGLVDPQGPASGLFLSTD